MHTQFAERLIRERLHQFRGGAATARDTAKALTRDPALAPAVVSVWRREIGATEELKSKLSLLHLCDEILRTSQGKTDAFAVAWLEPLSSVLSLLWRAADKQPEAADTLRRTVRQWEEYHIFDEAGTASIKAAIGCVDDADANISKSSDSSPTNKGKADRLMEAVQSLYRKQKAEITAAQHVGEENGSPSEEYDVFSLNLEKAQRETIVTQTHIVLTKLLQERETKAALPPVAATPPVPIPAGSVSSPSPDPHAKMKAELVELESHQLLLRDIIRVRATDQPLPSTVIHALPQLQAAFPDIMLPDPRSASAVELSYKWAKFDNVCRASLRQVQARLAEKRAVVDRAKGGSAAPAATPLPSSVPFSLLPRPPATPGPKWT